MNLRQKNKKLKQKLERYEQMYRYDKGGLYEKFGEYEIKTITAVRYFNNRDVLADVHDYAIRGLLLDDMSRELRHYLEVEESFGESGLNDAYKVIGKLCVAVPKNRT